MASCSLAGQRSFFQEHHGNWTLVKANGKNENLLEYMISGIDSQESNYAKATFDLENGKVTLETDYYGLRPLYYLNHKNSFVFSSEIEPMIELIKAQLTLNKKAINHFVIYGITPDHETFFNEIHLLAPNSKLEFQKGRITIKEKNKPFQGLNTPKLEDIRQTLEQSLNLWIEHYNIKHANLSGGADTRLLLALLSDERKRSFQFYVDASPFLDESQDKDVIAARLVADHLGLNLTTQPCSIVNVNKNNHFKRSAPSSRPKLSGNHGGEILGADVFSALSFIFNSNQEVDPKLFKEEFNPPKLVIPSSFKEKYEWSVQKLFTPFFTDIYGGGSFNHWTTPHRFHLRKVAPFWSNKLIYQLSLLKEHQVTQYNLYKEIYLKYFQDLAKIPFVSPLASHHAEFKQLEVGTNQKQTLRTDTPWDVYNKVLLDIEKQSLFYPETLKELIEARPEIANRCFKVTLWLKTFY